MKLSKEEITWIKGTAIFIIVCHNLLRILYFKECNECSFIISFIKYPPHFEILPFQILLYYGWLGVPLFVFLSGAGLSYKYKQTRFNYQKYILWNVSKLFVLFLPCFLICMILGFTGITNCPLSKKALFLQSTGLINFFAPSVFSWPGIYWYIGLTLQLYILFPLLSRFTEKQLIYIFLILIVILQIYCNTESTYLIAIRKNAIGWVHIFILGILYARINIPQIFFKHNRTSLITIALVCVTTSLYKYTWIIPELCIIPIFLILAKKLYKKQVSKYTIFIGSISASIFVVHPVLRLLVTPYKGDHTSLMLTLYIILFFSTTSAISYIYNIYLSKSYKFLNDKI